MVAFVIIVAYVEYLINYYIRGLISVYKYTNDF
jgi:hypothetical protein